MIDDDKIFRFVMGKAAKQTGMVEEVIFFRDGEEGINFIKKNATNEVELPDIIFLDINMPIMNGWEFLEEFVSIESIALKKIPIYILSSSIDRKDFKKSDVFPCIKEYLIKPFTQEKLKQVFGNHIDEL
ncbi:MAG: response regulator [Flammeovirgaceae bacterium]